ncbi:hypothetical protein [Allonocardiopsis opalescens]|uniref:Uncharacterized protein n=1 Tax=Allonocardiopsis opalescens TaxID=1144618 RepID=A0A2T0PT09_9ACTN|nr:hypothetical protein [Allonocardiopsis opalescens]PRX92033.1 hypothetical protein CLV72_112106 [Allonocardiopsis opalescens]
MPNPTEHCPDCGVGIGARHDTDCDWAQCAATGTQYLMCPDEGPDCRPDHWNGYMGGGKEAVDLGWWIVWVPPAPGEVGGRFVPCPPDMKDAIPDTQRVMRTHKWDRARECWVR